MGAAEELSGLAEEVGDLVVELEAELMRLSEIAEQLSEARARMPGPVTRATADDLARLGDEIAASAIAESALLLARTLDAGTATAAEIAACSRAHRAAMESLQALNPIEPEGDSVDRRRAHRDERMARQSAAGPASSP